VYAILIRISQFAKKILENFYFTFRDVTPFTRFFPENFCYGIDPLFDTPIFSYLKGGYEGGGTTLFVGDLMVRGI